MAWRRYPPDDDHNTAQSQHRSQPENPAHPDPAVQRRTGHQGKQKRRADTHSNQRHGLDPLLFPGQICHQRKHDRSNRAAALKCPADDHAGESICHGSNDTAGREYQQSENNQRFAAKPVRQSAEGDLEQGLRQAIDPDSEADHKRGCALHLGGIQRHDRQHQE